MRCALRSHSSSKVGERRALRARILVPPATGGVDFDGYRGWLRFTDDQAATFKEPGEGEGAPGEREFDELD